MESVIEFYCRVHDIRVAGFSDNLRYRFAGRDTLFYEDFNLVEFIEVFHQSPCKDSGGALVTFYRCKDSGKSRS